MFALHDHDYIHTRSSLNNNESDAIQLDNEDDHSNESYEVFDDEMLDPTFVVSNDINKDSIDQLNLDVSIDSVSCQNFTENIHDSIINSPLHIPIPTSNKKLSPAELKNNRLIKEDNKKEKAKLKHPFKDITCKDSCRQQCRHSDLTITHRKALWTDFWTQNYVGRRRFLATCIDIKPVKRRTTTSSLATKNQSRFFYLPSINSNRLQVCKSTFLCTFGYSNDSIITELCKYMKGDTPCLSAVKEYRGENNNLRTIDREIIINHIKTYNPCISHYRRHNAPNILYLPRELTVKMMHDDFCSKNEKLICQELYRSVLKSMNISLKKPNSDMCEDCCMFKNQIENLENENEIEVIKNKLEEHKLKAYQAHKMYKEDATIDISGTSFRVYSMDLQKVLLLPILPESKTSFFTSRLVVFNETFATLKPKGKGYCVLWHEAIASRKGENITDAILALIKEERDVTDFIFWADNCTGQNKNWILFTALVCILNTTYNTVESITIKYLTKGHTHMSADGIHGNIEKKIRKVRNVYDYDDLKQTILESRQNLGIIDQKNFFQWTSKKRTTNILLDPLKNFKLQNVVLVKFIKNSSKMLYSTNFDDKELKEMDFLQKKFIRGINTYKPKQIDQPRGVCVNKKNEIISKLLPLMPKSRENFWINLPVSVTSTDLVVNIGLTDEFLDECVI